MHDDKKPVPSAVRWSVMGLATYALIGGGVTLVGWFAGLPRLTDWVASGISMFPNAAFGAVCCGAALILARLNRRWSVRVSGLLGFIVLFLGSATLFQHFSGVSLGIDTILIKPAWGERAAVAPGRMGPPASTSYTLLGLALVLFANGHRGLRRIVPALGIAVCTIAALSLMGYVLGADPLFAVARFTGIAMQTASVLLALGLAVVAGVPECEPMRTLEQKSAGGLLARRSLPFIVGLPLVLGWLRVRGQLAGWFDTAMGTALLILVLVAIFCGLLWWWVGAVTKYERAQRQSEERLSLALRGGAMGAWDTDLETGENFWDDRVASLLGVPPEKAESESKRWTEFIHPEDRERVIAAFRAAGDGLLPAFNEDFRVIHRDGSIHWFASRGMLVVREGEHRRMIGVVMDITGRKQMEQALRESEALLSAVLKQLPVGLGVMDTKGQWIVSNALMDKFVPKAIPSTLPDRVERWRAYDTNDKPIPPEDWPGKRALRGEIVSPGMEMVFTGDDGCDRWLRVSAAPLRDDAGRIIGATAVVQDIDVIKKAEQALHDAHEQLADRAIHLEKLVRERTAKLQETVGELEAFSYSIAHDMRAPLRAMGSFAELLLENASSPGASAVAQEFCQRIVTSASRLDRLIQDALNYTKTMLAELPLEPVDLAKVLRGLIETYPNLHPDKADIRFDSTLPTVIGNESLLTQCFSNLLGNAVKFVPPGTRPEVRVWAETNNGTTRVWIQDNGIGIPKHAQARLFGMFQKLDNQYEGTGMGLAIVRKVVERMGGKVGFEPVPAQGSRFWIELQAVSITG